MGGVSCYGAWLIEILIIGMFSLMIISLEWEEYLVMGHVQTIGKINAIVTLRAGPPPLHSRLFGEARYFYQTLASGKGSTLQ